MQIGDEPIQRRGGIAEDTHVVVGKRCETIELRYQAVIVVGNGDDHVGASLTGAGPAVSHVHLRLAGASEVYNSPNYRYIQISWLHTKK
ncbi:hypothetical protein D3C83_108370 [compost metagenome]